jgi:hypothetical protein
MMDRQALLDTLVRDARPVRRLPSPARRLALWLAVVAGVVVAAAMLRGLRPDLGARMREPLFALELLATFGGAAALAALALRAAVPGREPARWQQGVALAIVASAGALCLRLPADTAPALARFIGAGVACALGLLSFAAVPWIALMIAVRRGAPFAFAATGALAGAAAFAAAYGVMRMVCRIDDGLHVAVWHALPAVAGVLVSIAIGAAWLRHWRA